eukprot:5221642-Prymnesium_polylepis.1
MKKTEVRESTAPIERRVSSGVSKSCWTDVTRPEWSGTRRGRAVREQGERERERESRGGGEGLAGVQGLGGQSIPDVMETPRKTQMNSKRKSLSKAERS